MKLTVFSLHLSQSEREEFEAEFKQKYEREKILLMEENKKLSNELDKVSIAYVSGLVISSTFSISCVGDNIDWIHSIHLYYDPIFLSSDGAPLIY